MQQISDLSELSPSEPESTVLATTMSGDVYTGTLPSIPEVAITPTGLDLPEVLQWDQWEEVGVYLANRQRNLEVSALHQAFCIGQWYDEGEQRYGEMAASAQAIADAASDSGWQLSPATVTTYASLYRRFGNAFQTLEGLTIKHLQAVRALDDQQEAVAMLEQAKESGEDSGDLRRRVKERLSPEDSLPEVKRAEPPAHPEMSQREIMLGIVLSDMIERVLDHGAPKWLGEILDDVLGRLSEEGEDWAKAILENGSKES